MPSQFQKIALPLLVMPVLWLCMQPAYCETLKIEFVASEPCALVMFLNILAERHHTSSWVKEWYEKKVASASVNKPATIKTRSNSSATPPIKFDLDSDKHFIESYKRLIDREEKHFKYIDEIGRSRSVDEVILCEAARSKTLPELLSRMKGKLSLDEIASLQCALYHFERPFQELVWKPRSLILQRQLEEFRTQTVKTKMCERLTQVRDFLNSSYPSQTPFIVALSPLPANKRSSGQSMGIVQVVELRPNDGFHSMADVVFHEAVHALWFSKKDVEETIKLFAIPDKGALPVAELYEGVATALGQGWFSKQAFGRTPKNWYSDSIINLYSQVVMPLYADYLKQGRKLDAAFGKEATAVYYRMYPEANKLISLTSSYVILADEMKDFSAFRNDLYKAMPRLRECSINTPPNARESIESLETTHAERVAILTSSAKLEQLKVLGFADLDLEKPKKISNGFTTIDFRGKKILFCLAETSDQQKKIFADVLKLQKWPM